MQKVKKLIAKFWAGLTTGEENKRLHDYLDLQDGEWKNALQKEYEQAIKEESVFIEEDRSANVLEKIHWRITGTKRDIQEANREVQQRKMEMQQKALGVEQLPHVKTAVILPGWIKWAAAVIIIMVAGWKIYQLNYRMAVDQVLAGRQTDYSHSKKLKRQQINKGNTPLNLNLTDGSSVLLQPGASVTYEERFNGGDKRNILLTGDAFFKVAKDAKRPFTVYAKGFTITALGTEFTVNARQVNGISVKLIKGKVVVRTTPESGMKMKDAYLTPGGELRINTVTQQYDIRNFNTGNRDRPATIRKAITPGLTDSNNLAFNKESLLKVFTRLGAHYNVKFEYEKEQIQLLSFTGTFRPSDSLRMVLPVICNMNDLTYRLDSNNVIITMQK